MSRYRDPQLQVDENYPLLSDCYVDQIFTIATAWISIYMTKTGIWHDTKNIENDYSCAQRFNPLSAELICKKKHRNQRVFHLEICINVLVSFFRFIWIPMLEVYGY